LIRRDPAIMWPSTSGSSTFATATCSSSGRYGRPSMMSEKVCYCYEDDEVDEAAKIMAEHQVKRLPVLNRQKRLVGIVALSDIGRSDGDCAQMALEGISEETGHTRRM